MNHNNKQIYSNREGANGSHRINDHLRESTIKTAHRRPLNNNTANTMHLSDCLSHLVTDQPPIDKTP